MNQIQAGDQIIRYDRGRTTAAYSAINGGGADRCSCPSCLNYAAQRRTAFPDYFRHFLGQLRIDPEKEGEAYECGPDGTLITYGGWFYFVGEFIQSGERMTTDPFTGFQYWFADAKRLPKPYGDFGEKVLAVEFTAKLPWIIS